MTIRQSIIALAAAMLGALTMGAQVRCSQAGAHPPFIATDATPKAFQMVGASTDEVTGDAGVFGMTIACQLDFPASRMCESEEAMGTVEVPTDIVSDAWVRPSWSANGLDSSGIARVPNELTCAGWQGQNPTV